MLPLELVDVAMHQPRLVALVHTQPAAGDADPLPARRDEFVRFGRADGDTARAGADGATPLKTREVLRVTIDNIPLAVAL